MQSSRLSALLVLPIVALMATAVTAEPEESISGPVSTVDLRYRLEGVDQEGVAKDALASTARLRVGIETPDWHGLDAGITFHGNRVIGNRLYNDTVTPTNRPVVADPADTGISQAWLRYRAGESFQAKVGRQRIIDDNARFLGNVGFRQLEQTFDAATLDWSPGKWDFDVHYLDRAHRIFGTSHPNPLLAEADLDSWVGIVSREVGGSDVGVYYHRFVYEDRALSHRNAGVRLDGAVPGTDSFTYRLEFASQSGVDGQGPAEDQSFIHAEIGQSFDNWNWMVAHQQLSGDGTDSFQTPLATLHAHNGWADQFLSTPATGLLDTWIGVGTSLGKWKLVARLHDYSSDVGSLHYGQELDLAAGRALFGPWKTQIKLAQFSGDDGRVDVSKIWWTLSASW